jgi:hypothetical protein
VTNTNTSSPQNAQPINLPVATPQPTGSDDNNVNPVNTQERTERTERPRKPRSRFHPRHRHAKPHARRSENNEKHKLAGEDIYSNKKSGEDE